MVSFSTVVGAGVTSVVLLGAFLVLGRLVDAAVRHSLDGPPDDAALDFESVDRAAEQFDDYDPADVIEILLGELRRRHDDQMARRETIEQKIGIVVGINTLVVAFVSQTDALASFAGRLVVATPSLLAVVAGLLVLRGRRYAFPTRRAEFESFVEFTSPDLLNRRLYNNYLAAIGTNRFHNEHRYRTFRVCFWLTVYSMSLLAGVLAVTRL